MTLPQIIQGGMGVAVSHWRLARTVSMLGQLGVVSGTAMNSVVIRRLQNGDLHGHVKRALEHFFDAEAAETFLALYLQPEGRSPRQLYKRDASPTANATLSLQQHHAMACFVEVFLAKEGHEGLVGINFLEKIQVANLPGLYGAMLAGVDAVLIGAGIPREIPGVLDRFVNH